MDKLKIEYVNINSIKPYKKNPRKNENAVPYVMESIKQFGFKNPVILDKDNVIIAGHTRIESAKRLGITEIPCIYADDLTKEQIKAFRLADNKVAEIAEWDIDLLNDELDDILDIDMSDFGFDLDFDVEEEKGIVEDEAPDVPEEPKAKLGDIYQLGNHRLMCGDSTSEDDVSKLMNGVKADMVFTDPPYNMHYSGMGIIPENERVQTMVDFDANTIDWLNKSNYGSIYIFTSKDLIPDYLKIFKDWKFNILIWEKTNNPPLTMNTFLPDIEYLLYFHKGDRIWNNSLKPMEIYKKVYSSSRQEGQKDVGNLHPTMKPINLICDKLKISSNENSIVLDLFGGSGSTLIACEQLNRKCYMMELDPHYIDVIIQRWENFTGEKAIKLN